MSTIRHGHIKAGWDSLRSAKLRSFWTMLGVIIGVASVITIVAIGEGVKQQVNGQLQHLGKDLITVRPAQIKAGGGTEIKPAVLSDIAVTSYLTNKDVLTIGQAKGVTASAPLAVAGGLIKGENGYYKDGYVIGTSESFTDMLKQPIAYGSFLTTDDMGQNAAVLGKHAADALFNDNVPLGRSFIFHGQEFLVRGIFDDTTTTLFSQQIDINSSIFIPYDVAEQITNNSAPTYEVLAKAQNTSLAPGVSQKISQKLDQIHGGQSNFSVQLGAQGSGSTNYILELLTRMIAGVAAISLLVGGIGIMNVMLVSVAERVHEIGIRKAVGATNFQILNQFLAEATVLSFVGGIIGIGLAYVATILLHYLTNIQPVITWQVVVIASAASLLVGIIFGSAPALKAARKDPIDALRAE
jgi:putative ABC transport system permease protein